MTPEEKDAIRKRLDNVYLECWQPFDSVPDDEWKAAYEDISNLLDEIDRLEGSAVWHCECGGRLRPDILICDTCGRKEAS